MLFFGTLSPFFVSDPLTIHTRESRQKQGEEGEEPLSFFLSLAQLIEATAEIESITVPQYSSRNPSEVQHSSSLLLFSTKKAKIGDKEGGLSCFWRCTTVLIFLTTVYIAIYFLFVFLFLQRINVKWLKFYV